MVLVTGAAGKTGKAVLRALQRRGVPTRAFVRNSAQLNELLSLGVSSAITGDLAQAADVRAALQRVQAVYAIFPNMHPNESELANTLIESARDAGLEHFVYHSVLQPQTEAMPHHWQKLRVEETLLRSGLPFTVVQPAAYFQNVLAYRAEILEQGRFAMPYATTARVRMIDLADVATIAASALQDETHFGATYQLASADDLSQDEIAESIGRAIGARVRTNFRSREEWAARARADGLGDYQISALLAMFEYYERSGLPGNANVARWLLGREPTTFAEFCARELGAWKDALAVPLTRRAARGQPGGRRSVRGRGARRA